jgi:hypothetical protein
MTRIDLGPDLERLGEALHASTTIDLTSEERADAAIATRARRTWRRLPVFAGSTLGLAGVGAALVLILGGSTAPPAFAVTRTADGSVLVKLSYAQHQNLPQVNQKLAEMGTNEQIGIVMGSGPAPVGGAVTCTPQPGVSGPTVRVLDGTDGTEVIKPGESGGNTAEGTFHLVSCGVYPAHTSLSTLRGYTGNSGNS